MDIKAFRIVAAVAIGVAAIATAAAPSAGAAPSPVPKLCVVADELVMCPAPDPTQIANFPGAVHLSPYGNLPAP